jgi:signal transduction histidine kinase
VHAFAASGALRLAAGAALLCVVAGWTFIGGIAIGWVLPPLLAYVAVAATAFLSRRRRFAQRFALLMPFLDVSLAFVLHLRGMTMSPSVAAAWAITSLGVYTMIVAVVGLSLSVRMVVVVTVLSVAAEWLLLCIPGDRYVTLPAAAVATFSLAFVAIATSAVPRMVETALRREQQAAATTESLAQAQEQNRQLGRLQREKDSLFEIIVHDMRSPISAAMLSLEFLSMELNKQTGQAPLLEATDDALGTLNTLTGMIGQILDTAKLEDGRITLRLERSELRPILDSVSRGLLPRAAGRSIAVELDAPDELKAAVDLRLFPRALESLVTHVLRHTSEGGRLRLVATRGERDVIVSLHSTAPAVPVAERERIFDKFPFAATDTRRATGWGPGLYFCALVVSAHQGSIAFADIVGWPSSYVIRLPAVS